MKRPCGEARNSRASVYLPVSRRLSLSRLGLGRGRLARSVVSQMLVEDLRSIHKHVLFWFWFQSDMSLLGAPMCSRSLPWAGVEHSLSWSKLNRFLLKMSPPGSAFAACCLTNGPRGLANSSLKDTRVGICAYFRPDE